jgi:PEP-CTERM motif
MRKKSAAQGLVGAALLLVTALSHATVITYTANNVGGDTWRFDYALLNDTLNAPIEEFTIFFDRDLFSNLSFGAAPEGWDPLVVQPDLQLPDNGFFDALALGGGLAAGESLSGFSVTAGWLGIGVPGSQLWTIVDPLSFATLESGSTSLFVPSEEPPPTSVPEPGSLALFAIGILGAASLRRRRTVA